MEEKTMILKQGSVGSFLRGLAVGAAIALLVAPRSGRETRDIITERGTELKEKAVDMVKDTRSKAENVIGDARNKVTRSMKEGEENVTNTEEQLKREAEIMDDVNNPVFPL